MPLTMPTGIANRPPSPTTVSEPRIAFAMPPPGSPTGLGISVKKLRLSDETPWDST